ncbi:MAG: M15 family metallopeptidase [Elusimicrobia bacterium]|nr:M15 family metallopeptidase [Elusimicrobiota bacterium]
MRRLIAAAALGAAACASTPRTVDEPLVDVRTVASGVRVDMPYATVNNFTHQVLYPESRCLLRQSVAKRLALVQADLAARGLGLLAWDCYRPLSIQRKLWEIVPDPNYVADPKKGSRHNRGAAVDVTLIDRAGARLEMPTDYDDFSPKAARDSPASPVATENRRLLSETMAKHGFEGLKSEWWHFDAKGWTVYPLEDVPLSAAR